MVHFVILPSNFWHDSQIALIFHQTFVNFLVFFVDSCFHCGSELISCMSVRLLKEHRKVATHCCKITASTSKLSSVVGTNLLYVKTALFQFLQRSFIPPGKLFQWLFQKNFEFSFLVVLVHSIYRESVSDARIAIWPSFLVKNLSLCSSWCSFYSLVMEICVARGKN